MATLAELRTQLRAHTVTTSTDLSDTQCDEFVNTAIERMQSQHDWGLQEAVSSPLTYGAATDGQSLPSDFIREVTVNEVDLTASDPSLQYLTIGKLEGGRAAWAERVHASDVSSTFPRPAISGRYYFLWAGSIYIVPQPSSDITVQVDYIKAQADLSGSSSNAFLTKYSRCVLWGALQVAYVFLHEPELAAAAGAVYADCLQAALKRDTSGRIGGGAKSRGA